MKQAVICKICSSLDNELLFNKDGFDIMKCKECDIVFTNLPKNFNLLSIYDSTYFEGGQEYGYSNYAESKKVLQKEFSKSVRLLREHTNDVRDLKLLEIGSAYGFFLEEAKDFFNCTGLEVSKDAASVSLNNGYRVIQDYYDHDNAVSIGRVDVVAMFDVIEHLPDPLATIRLIDQYLNKDGLIMITTGNIDSLLAKIMGKKWRLMTPPQHTFYFSKKTLSSLFKKMGYEIKLIDSPWKTVPIGLALYQVSSRLGLKIIPNRKLSRVSLPVNLFDTVRILVKKL